MNVLVDALKRINNGKRREVNDRFQSGHVPKVIIRLLTMMMKRSYIDKFEIIDEIYVWPECEQTLLMGYKLVKSLKIDRSFT